VHHGGNFIRWKSAPKIPICKALYAKEHLLSFPNDVDGDVLQRLDDSGFDFSKTWEIDFNVDFNSWPPSQEALNILEKEYGAIEVFEPEEESDGYVLFNIKSIVSYDLIMDTQRKASSLVSTFGGVCESWGVLH